MLKPSESNVYKFSSLPWFTVLMDGEMNGVRRILPTRLQLSLIFIYNLDRQLLGMETVSTEMLSFWKNLDSEKFFPTPKSNSRISSSEPIRLTFGPRIIIQFNI